MISLNGALRARAARLLKSVEAEAKLWSADCMCPERYLFNLAQALKPAETNATASKKTCRDCGGSVSILSMEQRRSADEGATVYLGCQKCKRQWRVNT